MAVAAAFECPAQPRGPTKLGCVLAGMTMTPVSWVIEFPAHTIRFLRLQRPDVDCTISIKKTARTTLIASGAFGPGRNSD
jgi:hypothetical protein